MVVEVVTPEQSLLAGPASAVVLRSSDGELTVLPGHTPLITDVLPGPVRVEGEDGEVRLAVHGGFLYVDTGPGAATGGDGTADDQTDARAATISTKVTLLAGVAELAADIDVARAETARDAAESRIAELRAGSPRDAEGTSGEDGAGLGGPAVELTEAEAARDRAELRVKVGGGSS